MRRRLVVEPDVEAEIADAAHWYNQENPGLGARFVAAVDEAVDKAVQQPFQYQTIMSGVRRVPVNKFPYGVIYRVTDDALTVIACFHARRNPMHWRRRG
jgi:plasmid stabilization system protein ParE